VILGAVVGVAAKRWLEHKAEKKEPEENADTDNVEQEPNSEPDDPPNRQKP